MKGKSYHFENEYFSTLRLLLSLTDLTVAYSFLFIKSSLKLVMVKKYTECLSWVQKQKDGSGS